MKSFCLFHQASKRAGVLVLTLLVLVLVSVIVLGLLASVTMERKATESNYQQRRALSMAMLGYQSGVSQLRDALGTGSNSWDNPYGNFATTPPSFYWSVSPGLLTRWSYTNSAPLTNIALFSYTAANNTNLINLNRPLADGSYPIIGGANSPYVSVQFVNVLQDPSQAASRSNPIVGRYAFWIDDESAKININVADGSRQKYSADWMKNSLGLGSPTEVSLLVLPQTNGLIATATASNIVYTARNSSPITTPFSINLAATPTSFHSPREILQVPGASEDLYTNNVFSLTDDSRSPDLNIFGQPKMALLPVLGDPHVGDNSWGGGQNMVINGISLQPETEIYPTQHQLPVVSVKWPIQYPGGTAANAFPWPLAFRGESPEWSTGRAGGPLGDVMLFGDNTNYCWNNGQIIARYLSGTNATGQPIQWPVFSPATSPNGFAGKYSFHQMDEIAVQVVSLGSKLISSDYPHVLSADYTNVVCSFPSEDSFENTNDYGFRYHAAPFLMDGWLSNQWVIGMGRTPKVTGLGIQLSTTSSQTTTVNGVTSYQPPQLAPTLFIEEWIPGSYRGGNTTPYTLAGNWELGGASSAYKVPQALNAADVGVNGGTGVSEDQSWLPRTANFDGDPQTNNTWANQLLTNDQGIDFEANRNNVHDPDQSLAAKYHSPWAQTGLPSDPDYFGAAPNIAANGTTTPFRMAALINNSDATEWPPGTQRCATSQWGSLCPLSMQTSADGGTLNIGGGISIIDCLDGGDVNSFTDPVPLEAIRGVTGGLANEYFIDAVQTGSYPFSVPSWDATNAMVGYTQPNPVTGLVTTRERNLASVIPVSISMPIPSPAGANPNPPPPYDVTNLYYTTTDPLVNKYPGDWHLSTNSFPGGWPSSPNSVTSYPEDAFLQSIAANGGDPDSFWVPQADVGFSARNMIASQTLIPRSARMPNIGYLQYIRTGIIPDDESTNYQYFPGHTNVTLQHGTPFRLFSYAPVNDAAYAASQETGRSSAPYPDWALLDLFYMPSIINAYGGPYANFTNLAPFGTYGGATSGRVNPNGSVIYTTNVNFPQPGVTRILPLQATLYGLHVNQTYDSSTADDQSLWAYKDITGTTTVMDAATSAALASNISYFISTNGPLKMPGEICDVPQVAALLAPVNHTRNDLVRQMVGELTTQSNVFSVWAAGQVIQKVPGNTQYGIFESGDQVLGEVRLHLIVERYLDPGADGVYGNTSNPGPDTVTNSMDDPVDPINHPFEPKYLYRVVRSEEVR